MALQTVTLQLTGTAPLIMHNNTTANPLSDYAKALKKLTGKRQKTEADYLEISRLEWEAGLYIHEGQVVVPAVNLWAALIEGGKKSKRGTKIRSGTNIVDNFCPLFYKGPRIAIKNGCREIPNPELDKFFPVYSYQTVVTVQKKSTLRTRPIFHNWVVRFGMYYDDTVMEADEILLVALDTGRLVGLGDWRPRFGRFEAGMI
jgi:hypothetical protein